MKSTSLPSLECVDGVMITALVFQGITCSLPSGEKRRMGRNHFIVPLKCHQPKKRGRDRNPASYKIQYPMKNHNKDAVKKRNAARCG
jgi:hypothetical protein